MKKTSIVTGGTKDQFPAMAVLAINIADVCPNIADELVIYHDGISLKEQNKIQKIFPTRFIEYKSPFLDVNNFDDVVTKYFSPMVFCKYECFNLLHDYKTVIWTDYDIVILKDISELKLRKKNSIKAITCDNIATKFYQTIYETDWKSFNIHGNGINTPIFVLFDSLECSNEIYNELIKNTKKYAPYLYLPEEAIISLVLQKNKIKNENLDMETYCTIPHKQIISEKTKIIHAAGQPKFWSGLDNNIWNKYHDLWINKFNGNSMIKRQHKKNLFVKFLTYFIPYGIIVLIGKIKCKTINK